MGIWVWTWDIPACKATVDGTLQGIVDRAKAANVGLMVKVHDGLTVSGAWDPNGEARPLIQLCLDQHVPVRAWGYCYPDVDFAGQARVALAPQVDYIADVEVEWDNKPAEANAFVTALVIERARLGRAEYMKLGYAPLPIISYHSSDPWASQYGAFNQLDVACPQAYAGTGGQSAIGALQWTEREWQKAFPAGVNLEPAVYAPDQGAEGLAQAIGYVKANGLVFGHDGDVSIWSFQHMSDEQWAVLPMLTELPTYGPPIAVSEAPALFAQSMSLSVKVGEVGVFTGAWAYEKVGGGYVIVFRQTKAYAHRRGTFPVVLRPTAEDLTTEHADAVPATWTLGVGAA